MVYMLKYVFLMLLKTYMSKYTCHELMKQDIQNSMKLTNANEN